MVMSGRKCLHRSGCRNPVRSDQDYCWLHGGSRLESASSSFGASAAVPLAELDRRREWFRNSSLKSGGAELRVPPSSTMGVSSADFIAQDFERAIGIPADTVKVILCAVESATGSMIVSEPTRALAERAKLPQIAGAISRELGPDRVSVLRLQGLARVFFHGDRYRRVVSAHADHNVILLDRGADGELLVDPFVCALAPVPEGSSHLPITRSGMTGVMKSPYVDELWIGSVDEYVRNGYMEWERAQIVA